MVNPSCHPPFFPRDTLGIQQPLNQWTFSRSVATSCAAKETLRGDKVRKGRRTFECGRKMRENQSYSMLFYVILLFLNGPWNGGWVNILFFSVILRGSLHWHGKKKTRSMKLKRNCSLRSSRVEEGWGKLRTSDGFSPPFTQFGLVLPFQVLHSTFSRPHLPFCLATWSRHGLLCIWWIPSLRLPSGKTYKKLLKMASSSWFTMIYPAAKWWCSRVGRIYFGVPSWNL